MPKIFISAGDVSGDIHAARLMSSLKNLITDIQFIGIGGDNMISQGLNSIIPLSSISVVGFWEVAKRYGLFKKLLEDSKKLISDDDVIAFIPVDYPGFNIRLAEYAHSIAKPVHYYIAPQLWAWGKDRAKKIAKVVDSLYVVFPFEEDYFKNFGINAKFIGHPLLDDNAFIKNDSQAENLIAMLPGSRLQEVKKHLPLFRETAEKLLNELPHFKIGLSVSKNVDIEIYKNFLPKSMNWELYDDARKLMQHSKAGIVKSGTSNLEAALIGMPFCLIYKTSEITYQMGKRLINLDYLSIINILLNKNSVREFIQKDATAHNISREIIKIINDQSYYKEMKQDFAKVRGILGTGGASKNAANLIYSSICK